VRHLRFRIVVLAAAAGVPVAASAATTFRVAVPAWTPPPDTVFVAGDFQGWNPGSPAHAMTRQPDGRWTIALSFAPGQSLQFKFTRGSWAEVEKGPSGEEIANRTLTPVDGATYDFTVANWADVGRASGTIAGHVEYFRFAPFLGGRRCWVYLPPGYHASANRYPVLYMHDGQNLFDAGSAAFGVEWRVDEACEQTIANGDIRPILVVGIDNGPNRIGEYTPWHDPNYAGSGGAAAYVNAVRDVLMPEVRRRYRTLNGPSNTYLAGSSLGGLVSAWAGYEYDEVFGRIAAVSPSYWWDGRAMLAHAQANPKPALSRFYHDIGTNEGGSAVVNVQDMRDILVAKGFVEGGDLRTVIATGHSHNEASWAARFPDLLRFLIDAPTTGVEGSTLTPELALGVRPQPIHGPGRFDFVLPRAGAARLDLYDVNGRLVRTLARGAHGAGRHEVAWDGLLGGRRAPAGVYWARLESNGAHVARRVVVVD
jgi:predicted alpha/beta superfamily hydrolase